MAGVVRRGGGPAPPLVRLGCSRRSARHYTLLDDPHVDADTPAVDYLFLFLYNSIIALSKLIFFRLRAAGLLPVARLVEGGQATS
jgi:hypothetical protein